MIRGGCSARPPSGRRGSLGHGAWAACVETEFDMKRRHSYRLLEHAEKMLALESAGVSSWASVSWV